MTPPASYPASPPAGRPGPRPPHRVFSGTVCSCEQCRNGRPAVTWVCWGRGTHKRLSRCLRRASEVPHPPPHPPLSPRLTCALCPDYRALWTPLSTGGRGQRSWGLSNSPEWEHPAWGCCSPFSPIRQSFLPTGGQLLSSRPAYLPHWVRPPTQHPLFWKLGTWDPRGLGRHGGAVGGQASAD